MEEAHFPDELSDPALNRRHIPAYTHNKRHDSFQPDPNTEQPFKFEHGKDVEQDGRIHTSDHEDDKPQLESGFNELGTEDTCLLYPSKDSAADRRRSYHETSSTEPAQLDGQSHSGVMTTGVRNVLDNLTPTGFSGSECSEPEEGSSRIELQNIRTSLSKRSRDSALQTSETSFPDVPPEPKLNPIQSSQISLDRSAIPTIPLDRTEKRHIRSRTYPILVRPSCQPVSCEEEDQLAPLTVSRTMLNTRAEARHTAPRFKGFDTLPPPKVVEYPPPPPLSTRKEPPTQSLRHQAHQNTSTSSNSTDGAQDVFYTTLSTKLMDLAKELESHDQDPRSAISTATTPSPTLPTTDSCVLPFDPSNPAHATEQRAADAADADVDSDTDIDADSASASAASSARSGSGDTTRHHRLGPALRHFTTRIEHFEPDADEHDANSLCGSDVDELLDWVKAKPDQPPRRRSEGRGRTRARERAARVGGAWALGRDC